MLSGKSSIFASENKTDVVKRLHHLLLIQNILGKYKKSNSQRDGNSIFCVVMFGRFSLRLRYELTVVAFVAAGYFQVVVMLGYVFYALPLQLGNPLGIQ